MKWKMFGPSMNENKSWYALDFNRIAPLMVTLAFIMVLIQYSFYPLEAFFYDLWVKLDITTDDIHEKVVVVTLDDESDMFLGETYPYSYATHVRLLNRIAQDKPGLINYFVNLLEPDSEIEMRYQDEFSDIIKKISPRHDHFRFGTDMDTFGELLPPDRLKNLGYSLATLNRDSLSFAKDDVVRRAILTISGEDSLHLWTAKKYREYLGLSNDQEQYKGTYYSPEADANFVLFKYLFNPIKKTSVPTIPFHRVVVGHFPPNYFTNKIVLIGPQYLSNGGDYVLTPFDKENIKVSKLTVHANIISSLINKQTVVEIREMYTKIAALIVSLILSLLISRVQPLRGLVMTVAIITAILLLSYLSFSIFGVWMKLAHLILSVFVVYYIWVPFRAIEEYQRRYAIQEETKLLKQVDNLKQNFISLMSHDLKTPVAKIAGIADILKIKFDNTAEQRSMLDNIVNATKELNSFITSILDLTKIESQNLTIKKESKDINKLIEGIVEKLRFEVHQKQMELETELSPLYPIQIDVILMNRVISNLVENAIKYAGKGKKVLVKTWDDADWVYIEVQDNGVGVSEEDILHIFDKFYRVKNDSTHAIKGSGLGLYLVKYFIELHNGTISAQSKLGEGTSFIIKLKNE